MNAPRTRLLVAADRDLRQALAEQVASASNAVLLAAESPRETLAMIASSSPDLLLIASDFSKGSAQDLLREAREAGFAGPAVLLARDSREQAGFDAVLSLPMRFARLLALIDALRAPRNQEGGPALTEKESAILARLERAGGEIVPREALLREVWGFREGVATHTLETHVHRLRRKLAHSPRCLQSAPGGYRLADKDRAASLRGK